MSTIAGHTFIDTPGGRACAGCGKKWIAVLADREFWRPGEPNIAHVGLLNGPEVEQLHAEVERIYACLAG